MCGCILIFSIVCKKYHFICNVMIFTEAKKGHGFSFFYALLSRDNDLLSGYLDITAFVFSW